jgi:hypothetical protein
VASAVRMEAERDRQRPAIETFERFLAAGQCFAHGSARGGVTPRGCEDAWRALAMAAKFKKIDPRMWSDEKFVMLDQLEMLIAIYTITAQSNRIGLFKFSAALAAEELRIPLETFRERFGKVSQTLGWGWDEALRVVYLPTWWRYNKPENPNVLKSCLDDLDDLPQTPLLEKFYGNLQYLAETLHQTFRERLPKCMPHHEHEHEHEHEHKPAGAKPQNLRLLKTRPSITTTTFRRSGWRASLCTDTARQFQFAGLTR